MAPILFLLEINIFMNRVYVNAFYDLIKERSLSTGFEMPEPVETYVVFLLAQRVEKPNLIPDPSFAEHYLTLTQNLKPLEIKNFADDCLFFTSLMPEYGKRRGLNMDYYCALGISSYYAYSDLMHEAFYTQMGNWFYHLRNFIEASLKPTGTHAFFNFSK